MALEEETMSTHAICVAAVAILFVAGALAAPASGGELPTTPNVDPHRSDYVPPPRVGSVTGYAALKQEWADWLRIHSDFNAMMAKHKISGNIQIQMREMARAEACALRGDYGEAVAIYGLAMEKLRYQYEFCVTSTYAKYFWSKDCQIRVALERGDRYTAENVLPDIRIHVPLWYKTLAPKVAKMPKPDLSKVTGEVLFDFATIPPGTFIMGATHDAPAGYLAHDGWKWAYSKPPAKGEMVVQSPPHEVTFTQPFLISKYEVTQKQWCQIMPFNPSVDKHPDAPVTNVSWEDCQLFLRLLRTRRPEMGYRLPTEAEWEYACRAGTTTDYFFGNDPSKASEYIPDPPEFNLNLKWVAPVGRKKPNRWGLYDMYGNVAEWCENWEYAYPGNDKLLAKLVKDHPGIGYDAPRSSNILYDSHRPGVLRGGASAGFAELARAWGGSAGRMWMSRWAS